MALFDDDGGVIVRPTILNCVEHERLNAARAALRCFRDCTIADIAAWRSRDAQGQPLPPGAQAATVLVDRKLYPARTHLADFYCFLWASYLKENPSDLTLAARYDAFLDQPPGQRRHVARRTDTYPPEGLSRLSDAAAIAALVGGRLLPPPFDELLTRIEPTPAPNTIYTLGYTSSTPAIVESYVKRLGAVLVDVRKSANSRVPHWRGAALAAQLGDRYLYLPDFGNDNYLGDGPIQLHNPAIVVEDARVLLQTQPIILLCGCADHRICHRSAAARYLAMWLNAQTQHLPARESSRTRVDQPVLGLGV